MDRLAQAAIAVVLIPSAIIGYVLLGELVIARVFRDPARARPWLWIAPALVLLTAFLVYPSIATLVLSLYDATGEHAVGLANYAAILLDPAVLGAFRNNAIWIVVFTSATVLLGLLAATLVDRVRYESFAKSLVFMPMAISFVAAGVIWRFVYDYRAPPLPQTGLLNAFFSWALPGFEPQAWLVNAIPLNNLALIVAATWTWTGFCMVVISAALKGVPTELIEAARVDGASEVQLFRQITIPTIAPTIAVVATTMTIFALKAFDIVYVMTNGNYDTEVLANRMYKEMFSVRDFGRASALAVILFVAIVPVMALNIRRFRQEEDATS